MLGLSLPSAMGGGKCDRSTVTRVARKHLVRHGPTTSRRAPTRSRRAPGQASVAWARPRGVAWCDARARFHTCRVPSPFAKVPQGHRRARSPTSRRIPSEAHLSAQRPQAGQEPRIPGPHVHPCWSVHHPQPACQGPGPAVGLIEPIRDRRTFEALRTDAIRVRRGPLSVAFLDEDPHGPTRLAFAVPKRVGNAVTRNRLRRRLRAILADLVRTEAAVLPGGAMMVSVAPDAVQRTFAELERDVIDVLDALQARRARSRGGR